MRILFLCLALATPAFADDPADLVTAARGQIGVTTVYDPAYVSLQFPGGDVDASRGVCTDVIVRAMRDGWGVDLQMAVNRDMKADFAAYPKIWGLSKTDRNIDHRRVGNQQTLFARVGAERPVTSDPANFLPGDIVSWMLPGNLPHIGIVSDKMGDSAPMVLHNIGRGAQEEDSLFEYDITGHYRITPDAAARLLALSTP